MKSITILLTTALLLGSATADATAGATDREPLTTTTPEKPYYLFRTSVGCDDDDDEDDEKAETDSIISRASGDGGEEYNGNEDATHDGDGYSPYPGRRRRGREQRQRQRQRGRGRGGRALIIAMDEKTNENGSDHGVKRRRGRKLKSKCAKSAKAEAGKDEGSKSAKVEGEGSEGEGGEGGESKGSKKSKSSKTISPKPSFSSTPTSPPSLAPSTSKPKDDLGYNPYPPPVPTSKPTTPPPKTPAPTPAPTKYTKSIAKPAYTKEDNCKALANGDDSMQTSSYSAELEYTYEAAIENEVVSIRSVKNAMENRLQLFVGNALMGCDDERRQRRGRRMPSESKEEAMQNSLLGRRLGNFEVVGVHHAPKDKVTDEWCTNFAGKKEIVDTDCYVINGGMTLYLSNPGDDPDRRILSSEDDLEESTREALAIMMAAMNEKDPSPFMEEGFSKYSVEGLRGVYFVSGKTHEGEYVEAEDDDSDMPVAGAISAAATTPSSQISTAGVSLLSVGIVALLALALTMLVVRKKRSSSADESYNEFKDDDDCEDDLDTDWKTDLDDGSLTFTQSIPSTPATVASTPARSSSKKRAYVVGEEGSVYTNATRDNRPFLQSMLLESGNDNDDDHQVDVHHCTSAMCPICNGKETVFVSALEDEVGQSNGVIRRNDSGISSSGSEDTEGYEFEYGSRSSSMKKSFAYEPKEEMAPPPQFSNPSKLERSYVVENTVEF